MKGFGLPAASRQVNEEKAGEDHPDKKIQDLADLANGVLDLVIEELTFTPEKDDPEHMRILKAQIDASINEISASLNKHLFLSDKEALRKIIVDEIVGYGPITSLLEDDSITEVMVNGPKDIYYERDGKLQKTQAEFRNNHHVLHIIDKIVSPLGRRVDESSPMVDARLPDGSRVNVIIPPLAITGPTITIRKFSKDPFSLEDLIGFGSLNENMAKFLRAAVQVRANILVSGGTGSGKTTLLNVLSGFISNDERIVTIEDAAELQLRQEHLVSLESRPANIEGKGRITIRDLVVNSLRMRPNRIIVGEVRSKEAIDMLQAMNTGHDGSLTTIHANSPKDSLSRLETMVLMAGTDLPSRAIRNQIVSAIHLIIQVARFPDGSRKITNITEVSGEEEGNILLRDLFTFLPLGVGEDNRIEGSFRPTGAQPMLLDKMRRIAENLPASMFMEPDENVGLL